MKNHSTILLAVILLAISCQSENGAKRHPDAASGTAPLYQSAAFSVYPDKIVQGKNEAVVLSATHIKSNYKSPASETFSRLVAFKFSINEKDNEAPSGKDHWLVIGDEHQSPVLVFGVPPTAPQPEKPTNPLPANFEYTFRVDMSAVLDQLEKQGYYEAYDKSRVAKADFKGFYIAGGAEPLSWDFVNLGNKGLKLEDPDGDKIYTLTVKLNPYKADDYKDKEWQLSVDISKKPQYKSDQPIVDALFNLSLEEAIKNIEQDSTLRTGAKWGGVWTRDISYSIFLAFAYHEPAIARISLMKKVKRDRIIQDTGSGGAWPVSSDRTTWALAAWEIYKTTGDLDWLKKAYAIIKNTVEDDYKTIKSAKTGLYSGESSFLDWREQTYPKWMNNVDIYSSENLGTNVVHYRTHIILAQMAKILGEPDQEYLARATAIKNGINQYLWMQNQGFYGQYLYGRPNLTLSPRFEALGEALAILFGVADDQRAKSILERSPITDFGVTCIYPQIPGIPPYHNNGIWPFVQSYWNLAAAKAGNEAALNHGLAAIYRAGGLFLTNYENFVAQTGDFMGTEINSDRMLWSMAGNLAMVHRVFMGMNFRPDGITFQPVIPHAYPGNKSLSNFKYRNALLNITVHGVGNQIKSIQLDGKTLDNAFLPATVTGTHTIDIVMKDNDFKGSINLVVNHFSLPNPQTKPNGTAMEWAAVPGAVQYFIYKNGMLAEKINVTNYTVPAGGFAEYKVSAVDIAGYESFTSEPLMFVAGQDVKKIEIEDYIPASRLKYSNFSGKGFVEISTTKNKTLTIPIKVETAGNYLLDLRYSNGSGPWNTDNKCAIRSLSVNNQYQGVLVFAQRGKDEWSDWGYSNPMTVPFAAGKNTVQISLEAWNSNMNVEINEAMLDYVRLIRL